MFFPDKSKIVFVDIDGVLATLNTRYNYFDLECVQRLNKILNTVPSVIVVSSTWRLGLSVPQLKTLFLTGSSGSRAIHNLVIQNNVDLSKAVIDKTPVTSSGYRGKEIELFLSKYAFKVNNFVILDDDSDMVPYMDRLVKTDSYKGLCDEDVEKAIEILRKDI